MRTSTQIADERKVTKLSTELKAKQLDPIKAIETFDDKTPIILFPVRLETKYKCNKEEEKYSLLVRIFPDDIAIQTHEPNITIKERDRLREYYDNISSKITELDISNSDKEYQTASKKHASKKDEIIKNEWRVLVEEFGPYRTLYLLQIDSSSLSDNEEEYTIGSKTICLLQDSEGEPPKSCVMPDKFIIKLFRDNSEIYKKLGNLIPNPLIVGPSLREIPEEEIPVPDNEGHCPDGWYPNEDGTSCEKDEYTLDADSEWLFNFNKAEEIGMAVQIPIQKSDIKKGFTKIIALGVKTSVTEETSKTLLEELMENHKYTKDCALLKIGTPTNNSGEDQSSFSTHDFGYDKAYELQNMEFTDDSEKDGYRLAHALGLEKDIFLHLENFYNTDNLDAEYMQNALWEATLGYYLKYMLASKSKDDETWNKFVQAFKIHFTKLVRARGPYSSIRISSMPYGILPITAFDKWKNNKQDSNIFSKDLVENDEKFNVLFLKWVTSFWKKWQDMAKNKEKVPYIGAYDDVERELVSILGIEAVSNTCKIRNVVSNYYVWNILQFGAPSLFNSGFTNFNLPFSINKPQLRNTHTLSYNLIMAWWEVAVKNNKETKMILDELGFTTGQYPTIASIQHWGNSRYIKPRVYEGVLPETEHLPQIGSESKNNMSLLENNSQVKANNYISLLKKNISHKKVDDKLTNPNSILYDLLKFSIPRSDPREARRSLSNLETLSIQSLQYLLSETLDLCTSRLDAFMTSLPHKRLQSIRKDHSGIQIGAYGWLENLPPYSDKCSKEGFIHAPSISHAITAGVLRNAYLTHAGEDNAKVMSINFSSDRVRRALWFLDAIREGQPLAALLGYQFERGLHENYLDKKLDKYINTLRELYPLKQDETEVDDDGAARETISARNVVDGLELLTKWKNDDIPFSNPKYSDNLPQPNSDDYKAIINELELLDDSLDAIGDMALTESVFQYVGGNHDRAGALIEALAGGGALSEPDVVKTPRGGISQEYKVMMLFNEDKKSSTDLKPKPRAFVEPRLNRFAEMILGDTEKISCYIEYGEEVREISLKNIMNGEISEFRYEYLSISPLDFILMSTSLPQGESTEIEQRISYYVRKKYSLPKDKEIKIYFKEPLNSEKISLLNLLEITRKMLDVIGNSIPIQSEDLHLPEEFKDIVGDETNEETEGDDSQIFAGFDELEKKIRGVTELNKNLEEKTYENDSLLQLKQKLVGSSEHPGLITKIKIAIRNNETNPLDNTLVDYLDEIRAVLFKISRFGITEAIPNSAIDIDINIVNDDLIRRAKAVVKEIDKRKNEYDENMKKCAKKELTIREKIPFLVNATKAIFGKSFTVMPKIIPKNKVKLGGAFTNATNEEEYSSKLWLQHVSITHKQLKKFETFAMYVKAITNKLNFDPKIAQLSYEEGSSRWMGLPFKNDDEKLQGTVSLVIFNPDNDKDIEFDKGIYGIILDEWLEMIPNKEEITGLAYHFDQPNSEPPQTILLSVSPELKENGKWKWDNLENSILDTLKLAKIRAVDYDALQGMGDMLPALYLPTNPVRTLATPNRIIPIEHVAMSVSNTEEGSD